MSLDLAVFYFFHNLTGRSAAFDAFIGFCLAYLPYLVVGSAVVWLLTAAYSKREKIEIAVVAALSALLARGVITEVIRFLTHRERPFTALDIAELGTNDGWSFPSGHSAFFFALAAAIWAYDRRWGTAFFALTLVMTLSRVAAGIHYPSDILAGAFVGIASTYGVFWAVRRFSKNHV